MSELFQQFPEGFCFFSSSPSLKVFQPWGCGLLWCTVIEIEGERKKKRKEKTNPKLKDNK